MMWMTSAKAKKETEVQSRSGEQFQNPRHTQGNNEAQRRGVKFSLIRKVKQLFLSLVIVVNNEQKTDRFHVTEALLVPDTTPTRP